MGFIDSLSFGATPQNLRDNKPLGFFTRIRHGKTGYNKAKKLLGNISNCNSRQDVMDTLEGFFNEKNRRFHKNSLSSFILDELKENNQAPWINIEVDKEKNRYNPDEVKSVFQPF